MKLSCTQRGLSSATCQRLHQLAGTPLPLTNTWISSKQIPGEMTSTAPVLVHRWQPFVDSIQLRAEKPVARAQAYEHLYIAQATAMLYPATSPFQSRHTRPAFRIAREAANTVLPLVCQRASGTQKVSFSSAVLSAVLQQMGSDGTVQKCNVPSSLHARIHNTVNTASVLGVALILLRHAGCA